MDGFGFGADHAHVVFCEHAHFVQLHGAIERGLTAQGREQSVGTFFDDDFFHHFRRDGLHVGAGRKFRIGHDGGRIGIDEDDFISFLAQGFACLYAGIVELAPLSDDNRAGANQKDFFDG